MKFKAMQRCQWWLPILSGIFIGTSYIPFPPWASLFGFVPLWLFWMQQSTLKNVVLGGMITSFVFTLIGFNWVTYLLHEFAHLNWTLSLVGMVIYGLIAHLFVPIAGLFWFLWQRRFNPSQRLSLVMMALLTTLSEFYSLTLFDWNFGYSWFGAGVPLYQWAEYIGFSGLSALTLLTNLAFYRAWVNRSNRTGKLTLMAVVWGFVLLNAGGLWLKSRVPAPDASLNTVLVQANIGNSEKMAAELGEGYTLEIFKRHLHLTDDALAKSKDKVDFVLWPETAFPVLLGDEFKFNDYPLALSQFLKERQQALITGAYSVDRSVRLMTNSLFALDSNGQLTAPHYSKTILLAFGEYIPGEQWFPDIRKWLPPTGHFARGAGPTALLTLDDFKIGPQICYESLFPKFMLGLAQLGAQFIVNVTNDSWYGTWQEPYQHMYMTLARGVEFRRPILRVTNTGISTVSLATGQILERSPIHEEWTGLYHVPYLKTPPVTFYQNYFYLVPILLWCGLITLLVMGWFAKEKR
ncbi:MAG: apolipoprotein N-acyltransferase [Methylicorpusculum sp.]|uniref:apolipoprotein N-acyltransferase n=1 Tax=Methylicorpusculum sp. TaxID=2713644 RepID=UPI0027211CD0|nr:apolipoprotein N-acyltransferase [Methylicorpusculum sp.]MDO8940541.1 apolipoprotein N-acyltransferase [Methylicorpusculum sp.]MDP2204453.1 apolipoprotein N-acyltransferase [Methylicorpusculum sp.]